MILLLFFLEYLINMQLPLSKMYMIVWEERKEARQTLPLVNSKNSVITGFIYSFSNETHIRVDFSS